MKQNTTEAKNVKKVLGLYLWSISTHFNSSRLWIVASEKSQDSQQSTDPFVVCHQKYLLPSNWHEGLQHLSDYRIFWENAFNGRVLFFPASANKPPHSLYWLTLFNSFFDTWTIHLGVYSFGYYVKASRDKSVNCFRVCFFCRLAKCLRKKNFHSKVKPKTRYFVFFLWENYDFGFLIRNCDQ